MIPYKPSLFPRKKGYLYNAPLLPTQLSQFCDTALQICALSLLYSKSSSSDQMLQNINQLVHYFGLRDPISNLHKMPSNLWSTWVLCHLRSWLFSDKRLKTVVTRHEPLDTLNIQNRSLIAFSHADRPLKGRIGFLHANFWMLK